MTSHSRRDFLKTAGLTVTGLLAAGPAAASSSEAPKVNNDELGMLYDATRCVGCKACMSACKRVNQAQGSLSPEKATFDPDGLWDAPRDLSGDTRTIIKLYQEGPVHSYVKQSCMHCQKPGCVSACPVSAMTKDKVTGIVSYDRTTCIGCRYCQVACAFNIPKFQWDRALPQIVKCDLCRETNLKTKGVTACAEVCPTGAIQFGKRKDLLKEAHRRLTESPRRYVPGIYGETEVGGVNHLYLAGVPFRKLAHPALPKMAPAEITESINKRIYKGFISHIALY